jgi:hypothetical protein
MRRAAACSSVFFAIVFASVSSPLYAGTSQSIAFDAIPSQILGVSPFPITAHATSGLSVSFTSNLTSVCTTAAGLVSLRAVGTCSITATQPGNATFNAATPVTRTLTVVAAKTSGSLTVSASGPFVTGFAPRAVAVSDFNGDGIPDLVTVNYASGDVTVLLGDGLGGFSAASGSPISLGSNTGPQSVAVGDFNGDGSADIAVADENAGNITVLLGNGTGGFTAATGSPFAAGTGPHSVVVGDFNGDGVEDLAMANYFTDNVTVLLGNGAGGFTAAAGSPFSVGASPYALAVADFNGDGIEDIASADLGSSTVTVLLGNGSGGFTAASASPFAVDQNPEAIVAGDFNGDGKADLTTANYTGNDVTVLLGNGSGGFSAAAGSPFAAGMNADALTAGDFNGDGVQDLAVGNYGGANVTILLGNGSGGFSAVKGDPFAAGPNPVYIATGDFNRDGIEDLAVVNNSTYRITVLLGFLTGSASQTITFGSLSNATSTSPAFSLTASSSSGLAVSFASETVFVCTISATTVSLTGGSGTCSIVASQNGNGTYAPAATVTQSFQVSQTNQTISFAPLSNVPSNQAPFTVSASASSGLSVSFSSSTTSVCTVSGNSVTIVSSGGCAVTASQPGNRTYAAAAPVTQKFTVLFGDASSGDYYYAAINALAQHGITAGCGSNNFCPSQAVTRDQMAIFMVRAVYGSDTFTYSTSPYFTDVQSSTFGFKWIQKLYELGVTSGCGSNMYCPAQVVTRDQMAVFIERVRLGLALAGSPPTFTYSTTPKFTDVSAGNFAFPWIQRLAADNITSGCGATTYCPGQPVTRGDMAIFIMRGAFNQFLPAGTPIVTQISPSTLARGATGPYTITGMNTNFVQGTTQLSGIPGVTIGTITVSSPTSLTVQLAAASGATAEPCSVIAVTGSEQAVLPNGLTIQ